MVHQCSVPSCRNEYGCKKNLSMHSFPLHIKGMVQQWIKAIGRDNNWYPTRNNRICSDHFAEDDYISVSSNRLKPTAIPSRLLSLTKPCLCQNQSERLLYFHEDQYDEGNPTTKNMPVTCIVRGCTSIRENGINFFRFPTKPQQREQWLKILNIPSLETPINSYVCSKHFEQKYIVTNNGNQLLLPGAVPLKFPHYIYSKNTSNLISIQPKPSSTIPIKKNIILKPLPFVVVPLQNNNTTSIPSNTINLKTQINQNFVNLQLPKITENNEFPASIPISENIVEISNYDEENSIENICNNDETDMETETESAISINSDNETQNSTKDESCYVLVEVNDKIDDNLNSQDEANIVASGFDIKELINDAKIAINNRIKSMPMPEKRTARSWRTNYVGDCVFEDMENPEIRKHHWTLALNEIKKLRLKVKSLEQKTRRLQKKLNGAKLTISQLKQKNEEDEQKESDDFFS